MTLEKVKRLSDWKMKNIYSTPGGRSEWKNALTAATVHMTNCWQVTHLRMERAHFSEISVKFYHMTSHSSRW
jgi:hypothetical protein